MFAIDVHQVGEVTVVPDHAENCFLQLGTARAGGLADGVDVGLTWWRCFARCWRRALR